MLPRRALNVVVGLAAAVVCWRVVVAPLYQLLHLGVRPHGPLAEDPDFYYALVAVSMLELGRALGIILSLAGIACALGTALGFAAGARQRKWARLWLWYLPVLWFAVDLLGRFQIQRWYADHGVLFPLTSFLWDFAWQNGRPQGVMPDLWWLLACWLATAPAILRGRGLYRLFSSSPAVPPP